MPTIQINPDYFIELGQLPFPLLLARLFLDGGWIIVLFVLIQGFWMLWVQSRQAKHAATVSHTLLAIDVPRENEQLPIAVEQIFSHLSAAYSGLDRYEKYWLGKFQPTFSFEIVSIEGYVQFIVRTPTKFRDLIEAAFFAQYPDADIIEIADYTDKVPANFPHPEWDVFGTEYVLKKPSAYPIRSYTEFMNKAVEDNPFKDPMSSVLETMSQLKRGEQLWYQILVTPNDDSWKDASEQVINKLTGKKSKPKKSMIDDALWLPQAVAHELAGMLTGGGEEPVKKPEDKPPQLGPGEKGAVDGIGAKAQKIGFHTKMRVVYVARRDVFSKGRMTAFKGAFGQFAALHMNSFKNYGAVTPKSDYAWQRWSEPAKKMAVLRNFRNRSGAGAPSFILNIEELATVYHFPVMGVKAPSVKKTEAKRAEPPSGLPTMESLGARPFTKIDQKPKEKPAALKPISDEDLDSEFDGGEAPADLPFA